MEYEAIRKANFVGDKLNPTLSVNIPAQIVRLLGFTEGQVLVSTDGKKIIIEKVVERTIRKQDQKKDPQEKKEVERESSGLRLADLQY